MTSRVFHSASMKHVKRPPDKADPEILSLIEAFKLLHIGEPKCELRHRNYLVIKATCSKQNHDDLADLVGSKMRYLIHHLEKNDNISMIHPDVYLVKADEKDPKSTYWLLGVVLTAKETKFKPVGLNGLMRSFTNFFNNIMKKSKNLKGGVTLTIKHMRMGKLSHVLRGRTLIKADNLRTKVKSCDQSQKAKADNATKRPPVGPPGRCREKSVQEQQSQSHQAPDAAPHQKPPITTRQGGFKKSGAPERDTQARRQKPELQPTNRPPLKGSRKRSCQEEGQVQERESRPQPASASHQKPSDHPRLAGKSRNPECDPPTKRQRPALAAETPPPDTSKRPHNKKSDQERSSSKPAADAGPQQKTSGPQQKPSEPQQKTSASTKKNSLKKSGDPENQTKVKSQKQDLQAAETPPPDTSKRPHNKKSDQKSSSSKPAADAGPKQKTSGPQQKTSGPQQKTSASTKKNGFKKSGDPENQTQASSQKQDLKSPPAKHHRAASDNRLPAPSRRRQ